MSVLAGMLPALKVIGALNQGSRRKLVFSTIGCPDWSLDEMLRFGRQHGFAGIEFRGVQRELDITKVTAFSTPQNIATTMAKMQDHQLSIVALAASSRMHVSAAADRVKQLDEAKRYIDLAAAVNCPYIRVFGDKLPKTEDKQQTIDRIVRGLTELGEYAKNTGVKVLMETHGDLVMSRDLYAIMTAVNRADVGVLWDFFNMWVGGNEPTAEAFRRIVPFVHHVQIKDGNKTATGYQLTLMGEGSSPLHEALSVLTEHRYNGFYTLEWEKLWHPELQDPEFAFPQFKTFMNNRK